MLKFLFFFFNIAKDTFETTSRKKHTPTHFAYERTFIIALNVRNDAARYFLLVQPSGRVDGVLEKLKRATTFKKESIFRNTFSAAYSSSIYTTDSAKRARSVYAKESTNTLVRIFLPGPAIFLRGNLDIYTQQVNP